MVNTVRLGDICRMKIVSRLIGYTVSCEDFTVIGQHRINRCQGAIDSRINSCVLLNDIIYLASSTDVHFQEQKEVNKKAVVHLTRHPNASMYVLSESLNIILPTLLYGVRAIVIYFLVFLIKKSSV